MEPLTEAQRKTLEDLYRRIDRPMACRTYGFYVSRGTGNWCHLILGLVEQHGDGDIVWGNQDAMEDTLARLSGDTVPLLEWFSTAPTEGC